MAFGHGDFWPLDMDSPKIVLLNSIYLKVFSLFDPAE